MLVCCEESVLVEDDAEAGMRDASEDIPPALVVVDAADDDVLDDDDAADDDAADDDAADDDAAEDEKWPVVSDFPSPPRAQDNNGIVAEPSSL